jgi:hypothetical protein
VLASAGLVWCAARLAAGPRRRLGWALAVAALPTALFLYVGVILSAISNAPIEVYVAPRVEWEAGEWLAARMRPTDIVLAAEDTGFWLAALVPGRVWLGHKGITYDVPAKREAVREVLAAPAATAAGRLQRLGVTYLYYGPRERRYDGAIAETAGLRRIYDAGGVQIFRVESAGVADVPSAARSRWPRLDVIFALGRAGGARRRARGA